LDALGDQLVRTPHNVHAVLALVDCSKITTSTDTDSAEATARILRVEAIGDDDKTAAANMMRRALEQRTGQTMLEGFDKDIDKDMIAAFGSAAT
jgi:hypothetical protein